MKSKKSKIHKWTNISVNCENIFNKKKLANLIDVLNPCNCALLLLVGLQVCIGRYKHAIVACHPFRNCLWWLAKNLTCHSAMVAPFNNIGYIETIPPHPTPHHNKFARYPGIANAYLCVVCNVPGTGMAHKLKYPCLRFNMAYMHLFICIFYVAAVIRPVI